MMINTNINKLSETGFSIPLTLIDKTRNRNPVRLKDFELIQIDIGTALQDGLYSIYMTYVDTVEYVQYYTFTKRYYGRYTKIEDFIREYIRDDEYIPKEYKVYEMPDIECKKLWNTVLKYLFCIIRDNNNFYIIRLFDDEDDDEKF